MTARRFLWPKSLAGKTGIVIAAMAMLLFAAYWGARCNSAKRLAAAWKLSDEFGLPTDFEELLGEKISDDDNAAIPLDVAAALAGQFLTAEMKRIAAATKNVRFEYDIVLEDPTFFAATDQFLRKTDYARLLAEAERRSGYHSRVGLKSRALDSRRNLGRLQQAIARRLAAQGRRDDAAQQLLLLAKLTRRWEDKEPYYGGATTNLQVRSGIIVELNRLLRRGGPMAAAVHDAIDREAAETEQVLRIMPRVGQGEKSATLRAFDEYFPRFARSQAARPFADLDRAILVRNIHRWMRTYDKPFFEARTEIEAMDAEFVATFNDWFRRSFQPGGRMVMPALTPLRRVFDQTVVYARCLRVINAMARRNDFNAKLEALNLPKESLIDPFDGQTLRVKKTPDGSIIYSVGPNLKDDGGRFIPPDDVGLGPLEPGAK